MKDGKPQGSAFFEDKEQLKRHFVDAEEDEDEDSDNSFEIDDSVADKNFADIDPTKLIDLELIKLLKYCHNLKEQY